MKKSFIYMIAAVAIASVLSSCDMNLKPTTSIAYVEGEPLMISDTDVSEFENGILTSFRSRFDGVYYQTQEVMVDYFNASADYGNNYGAVHRMDVDFTDGEYNTRDHWSGHFGAIKNYNIFIENADNVADDLKEYAQFVKGEALFCRAFSYLHLARHFGKPYGSSSSTDLAVPLVTVYDQLDKPARATVAEVYAQVKADLDAAAAILAGETGEARADYPTIDAVNARFKEIHNNYNELRWSWSYRIILDYYGIDELTEEAVQRIHQDYVTARREWISLIREDAENEYTLGDIDREVLDDFVTLLDREVDFENQKLYM